MEHCGFLISLLLLLSFFNFKSSITCPIPGLTGKIYSKNGLIFTHKISDHSRTHMLLTIIMSCEMLFGNLTHLSGHLPTRMTSTLHCTFPSLVHLNKLWLFLSRWKPLYIIVCERATESIQNLRRVNGAFKQYVISLLEHEDFSIIAMNVNKEGRSYRWGYSVLHRGKNSMFWRNLMTVMFLFM